MVYLNSFEVNGSLFIDFNGSWIRPLVKSTVQRRRANFRLETNPFRWEAPNGTQALPGEDDARCATICFSFQRWAILQTTFCSLDPACSGWKTEKDFSERIESEC